MYDHWPAKIVASSPQEALCVDLVGPYTCKGLDGSEKGQSTNDHNGQW
jgi:hypothetical protein